MQRRSLQVSGWSGRHPSVVPVPNPSQPPQTPPAPPASRTSHARVLFVHPTGPDRDLYAAALRDNGLDPLVTADLASAATALDHDPPPGLILIELLPEPMASWLFIKQQRRRLGAMPIVVLTSAIRPDRLNRDLAHTLGCAAFVAKPCSLTRLLDVLSRVRLGHWGLEISTYDARLD